MVRKCTPGVYIQVGEGGFRVGQSNCMERRIEQAAKKYGDCLGEIKNTIFIPEMNPTKRTKLERILIDGLDATNSCNIRRS